MGTSQMQFQSTVPARNFSLKIQPKAEEGPTAQADGEIIIQNDAYI